MVDPGWLRVAHVVGAVLLVGNVTVTGLWAAYLYQARREVPFRIVARAILWTDLVFTVGGGTLLVVSGALLVRAGGYAISDTPWLVQGIAALAASAVLWVTVLLPDQWRLERIAPADDATLKRVFLRWSIVGWTATALLFYGLWAMVSKR
ncbi:MAG TPA: DUF2269 family protein [Gemmatimonadales bacterium]|jgi:uncharacterized membrane protein|nr:DUF2269 family protein [Gemmatimonadales bacterium]